MRMMKRMAACLLAVLMLVSLCACGSFSDDVKLLIQGNLDEIYLGKFDTDYMKLVETTEAECQENYESGVAYEVEFFCYYFNIEFPTEELLADLTEQYKEIYSQAKYTVGDVSKLDDSTYAVKLTVEPINVIDLMIEAANNGALDAFYNKYSDTEISSMTDAEYEAYDQEWAQLILDLLKAQMANMSHEDPQTLAVQVVLENDVWTISESDMQSIDELIVCYP